MILLHITHVFSFMSTTSTLTRSYTTYYITPTITTISLSGTFSYSKIHSSSIPRRHTFLMRDGSTANTYFQIGQQIRVIKQVFHDPPSKQRFSSLDKIGIVIGVWEKCEVDPTCCCAELAFDAPIEVLFQGITIPVNATLYHFAYHTPVFDVSMYM